MDRGGGDGHEGGNRRGNESVRGEGRVRDTKERGGQREKMGGRRGGGKRQEGSGERETRHKGEGAKRDFNYGLQDVHTRFAGSYMELAKGMEQGERSTRHAVDVGKLGANEDEKHRRESDGERKLDEKAIVLDEKALGN